MLQTRASASFTIFIDFMIEHGKIHYKYGQIDEKITKKSMKKQVQSMQTRKKGQWPNLAATVAIVLKTLNKKMDFLKQVTLESPFFILLTGV